LADFVGARGVHWFRWRTDLHPVSVTGRHVFFETATPRPRYLRGWEFIRGFNLRRNSSAIVTKIGICVGNASLRVRDNGEHDTCKLFAQAETD